MSQIIDQWIGKISNIPSDAIRTVMYRFVKTRYAIK